MLSPTGAITVVMPAFNEAATISATLNKVLAQPCVTEILVVDDGSTDGTWRQLLERAELEPRIRPLRHDHNRGKGAALRTAFPHVRAAIVVIQDADLEYDPACYDALIGPILEGRADVVFGSRFASQGPHRVLYFWHSLGNRFLTLLSNMATDLNLTDMETGYKVFRSDLLKSFTLTEERFGIEPELTAKLARLRPRIYEIGIAYHGRTYGEGKKITWRDGISALWCIAKYRFLK